MRERLLPSTITTLAVTLAACASPGQVAPEEPPAPAGVFFPRLIESQDSWPAALASGTLVERRGCVLLMPGDVPDARWRTAELLIWPEEARAEQTDGGDLRITVGGRLVGETGDQVQLGGGLLGESRDTVDQAERLIGEPIPERCRADGGYWLTAPPS
jgi:hypothetical protein